jgi:hypothetical protein
MAQTGQMGIGFYHRVFEIHINKTQPVIIPTMANHHKGILVFPKEFHAPVLHGNLHQHKTIRLGTAAQLHQAARSKRSCHQAKIVFFLGRAQPSGYTEPLLHAWRLKVKAGG